MFKKFTISTCKTNELVNITRIVQEAIDESNTKSGICVVYNPHTTAAITVNESCDPDVVSDIIMALKKIVPEEDNYKHYEGNSSAHIKSSMLNSNSSFIIDQSKLVLGRWQAIYFCEFDGPRERSFYVKIIPDPVNNNLDSIDI